MQIRIYNNKKEPLKFSIEQIGDKYLFKFKDNKIEMNINNPKKILVEKLDSKDIKQKLNLIK